MYEVMERTYARVDLDAVKDNLRALRERTGKEILAVVKADAYGHGAEAVSHAVEEIAAGFAVATAEEALSLRKNGIEKPILILGPVPPAALPELVRAEIRLTAFETEQISRMEEEALRAGKNCYYHIKVDTGMGRIGLQPDDTGFETVMSFRQYPHCIPEGIFTHLSCADTDDPGPTRRQLALFREFTERLIHSGMQFPLIHSENSAAGILYPTETFSNLTRAGIAMYGIEPSSDADYSAVSLRPALSLYSEVTFVKTVPAGTPISYGAKFVTERESRIATISIGYADGYPRSLSGKAEVLIRGHRVPLAGRICMDQMMADVSEFPDIREGDPVTLVGKDGEEEITLRELGELSGRFPYEFLCCLQKRIPRVYIENGRINSISSSFL